MLVRRKISLGFVIVGFILLLSSLIAIFEFYNMKHTVSEVVVDDISKINISQRLLDIAESYNDKLILAFQSEEINLKDVVRSIKSDREFTQNLDSLRNSIERSAVKSPFAKDSLNFQMQLADSIRYTYFAHIYHVAQLQKISDSSDFSPRDWYLDKFYPNHTNLTRHIKSLNAVFQNSFTKNSESLNESFRRSLMPCIVAVAIGIILLFLFNYFLNFYFLSPLDKITKGIKSYISTKRSYDYNLQSNDEMQEINDNVRELITENRKLIKEQNQ